MVTRAVYALCLTTIILFSIQIARKFNFSRISQVALGIVIVTYAKFSSNLYTMLAYVFFMLCFYMIVYRLNATNKNLITLIMAGISAGLCFSSKYNIGIYLLTALILSLFLEKHRYAIPIKKLFINTSILLVSFVVPIILTLLPVMLSGGFSKFLEYGFFAKGNYLELGKISYFDGLLKTGNFLTQSIFHFKKLQTPFLHTVFFLPFLLVPLLIWLLIRSKGNIKHATYIMILFYIASFLVIVPRADIHHLQFAIPVSFIAFLFALHQLKKYSYKLFRFLFIGTICWIILGFTYIAEVKIRNMVSEKYHYSTIPHFLGIPVHRDHHKNYKDTISKISSVAKDKKVFFLTPQAGFFYLTTGLKNLTPFDFPLATAFGLHGQSKVISAIESGKINLVFMEKKSGGISCPITLENYVETRMKFIGNIRTLSVYEHEIK
jgi:hypothetical protein